MPGGKLSPDQCNLAIRKEKASELRLKGYTFRQIGEELGISHVQAFQDVQVALSETRSHTAEICENLRELEGQRLDGIWLKLSTTLATTGSPSDLAKLTQQLHRNIELRMRLYGLESAKRLEIQNMMDVQVTEFINVLEKLLPEDTYKEILNAIDKISDLYEQPSITVIPDYN